MFTPPYQLMQHHEFASLLGRIRDCREVDEFIETYDAGIVYSCLDRIRTSLRQSGMSVEAWAEDWAKRLYKGDEDAKTLNNDRKLSLELLYTLCDRLKGVKGPQTLTADNVVRDFGNKRIMGILGLCLPMDCANALNNMTIPGESLPGTHWVSAIHVARDIEWAERMSHYDGFPTMNRRFLWLMEDEELVGLKLGNNNFMRKWTTPMEAHRSIEDFYLV